MWFDVGGVIARFQQFTLCRVYELMRPASNDKIALHEAQLAGPKFGLRGGAGR